MHLFLGCSLINDPDCALLEELETLLLVHPQGCIYFVRTREKEKSGNGQDWEWCQPAARWTVANMLLCLTLQKTVFMDVLAVCWIYGFNFEVRLRPALNSTLSYIKMISVGKGVFPLMWNLMYVSCHAWIVIASMSCLINVVRHLVHISPFMMQWSPEKCVNRS